MCFELSLRFGLVELISTMISWNDKIPEFHFLSVVWWRDFSQTMSVLLITADYLWHFYFLIISQDYKLADNFSRYFLLHMSIRTILTPPQKLQVYELTVPKSRKSCENFLLFIVLFSSMIFFWCKLPSNSCIKIRSYYSVRKSPPKSFSTSTAQTLNIQKD